MADIAGKPMLQRVLERVSKAQLGRLGVDRDHVSFRR